MGAQHSKEYLINNFDKIKKNHHSPNWPKSLFLSEPETKVLFAVSEKKFKFVITESS